MSTVDCDARGTSSALVGSSGSVRDMAAGRNLWAAAEVEAGGARVEVVD